MILTFYELIPFYKKIILSIIYFIQLLSSLFTLLRNPGTPKRENFYSSFGIKKFKICKLCNVIMNLDKKTYHCKYCDICVIGILIIFYLFLFILIKF